MKSLNPMKKTILLFIGLINVFSSTLFAQNELYMPIEYQKAYKLNTRSVDGAPGNKYWQNFSSYFITAEIEPGTWKIKGNQKITYNNDSPDSLHTIIIKCYPNHYKKGAPRAVQIPVENITDGMKITDLTIDTISINLVGNPDVKSLGTYYEIQLSKPIPPNNSIVLTMNWTTEMPSTYVNRIGAYDKSSAFIGYWYPQIASYNDIDGWDKMEYLGSQETNNDYADFNVIIKTPAGYNVWATGALQNPDEVFSKVALERFNKAKSSSKNITVFDGEDANTTSDNVQKNWKFKAENVTDFALGVSDNFLWMGNSMMVNGKPISTNLVFDKLNLKTAEQLLQVQNEAIDYLSNVYPKVDYPFRQFTTFLGVPEFDGMEFPMMANNGVSKDEVENTAVTFHELAHTYFPFLIGINEVKYSWMEEGWTAFFTIRFLQHYYRNKPEKDAELKKTLKFYNNSAGKAWDLPLITPSYLLTYRPAHGQLSYMKSACMYLTLEHLLGVETFKKCLKIYIERWRGKHPTPYDFMYTFNNASNSNLNWFWKKWIFENAYGDLGIAKVEKSKVYIQNVGGLPLPVFLKLNYENGREMFIEKNATIWNEVNDKLVSIDILDADKLTRIELIDNYFPDADKKNNFREIKK